MSTQGKRGQSSAEPGGWLEALPDELLAPMPRRTLSAGEVLLKEGEASHSFYIVVSGRLEVMRQVHQRVEHRIHVIGPGEPIGEIAFFDGLPSSATVRAIEPTEVIEVGYDQVTPALSQRLAERLAERLRATSADEAHGEHRRLVMGLLVVKIIVLSCGYALLLAALPDLQLAGRSTTLLSLPLIAAFGFAAWRFLRATRTPLAHFGLGTRALLPSLFESLLLTPLFCGLLVLLKWVALQVHGPWRGYPLFERPDWREALMDPNTAKLLLVYLVSAAVQELIVRSALQASLEEFVVGRHARRTTLLVCALMFAMNHLHMSFVFAAAAFIPGVFWGWLFSRRRNLLGPVLSHFLVGAFVFFILGVSLP